MISEPDHNDGQSAIFMVLAILLGLGIAVFIIGWCWLLLPKGE
jgi:hypothetical protein